MFSKVDGLNIVQENARGFPQFIHRLLSQTASFHFLPYSPISDVPLLVRCFVTLVCGAAVTNWPGK